MQNVVVLGSTGSIGKQTLDIVARHENQFRVIGLSANENTECLFQQVEQFLPDSITLSNEEKAKTLQSMLKKAAEGSGFRGDSLPNILTSQDGLITLASLREADIVVNALSGTVGIEPTLAAIRAGKKILLANKESIVCAGELFVKEAAQTGSQIIPIDSELTGLVQCLRGEHKEDVEKIILTCSGGPLREKNAQEMATASIEEVLDHPTWSMGKKITVDSATLMNKGFELIATNVLFDIPAEQIEIVVHPESIIHSMVQWKDGNISALLSPPNMEHAIEYALFAPKRSRNSLKRLDLTQQPLTFERPNENLFQSLALARKAAHLQGTLPAILCAANDFAVERFLAGDLHFGEIIPSVREHVDLHEYKKNPSLDDILSLANSFS